MFTWCNCPSYSSPAFGSTAIWITVESVVLSSSVKAEPDVGLLSCNGLEPLFELTETIMLAGRLPLSCTASIEAEAGNMLELELEDDTFNVVFLTGATRGPAPVLDTISVPLACCLMAKI